MGEATGVAYHYQPGDAPTVFDYTTCAEVSLVASREVEGAGRIVFPPTWLVGWLGVLHPACR